MDKIPNEKDVLEEATKKLIPIAKRQEMYDKYFGPKRQKEKNLLKIEEYFKKKISEDIKNKLGLEDKSLDKIQKILFAISKLNSSNIAMLDSQFSEKNECEIQTEENDYSLLIQKVSLLEKEKEKLLIEKSEFEKENEILKKQNIDLKNENDKFLKEIRFLKNSINELNNLKSDSEKNFQNLKNENIKFQNQNISLQKKIDDLTKLKKQFEEKSEIKKNKKEIMKNLFFSNQKINSPFIYLLQTHQLNKVFSYLSINDICNFIISNKKINNSFKNSITNAKNFYITTIKRKNEIITSLKKYDIKKVYLIKNPKLEQLIKEYVLTNKIPGKELKNTVGKCLNFINKEVKIPLGYNPSKLKTQKTEEKIENNNNQYYGYNLFSGFTNMFNYGNKQLKTENNNLTPNKNKSSNNSKNGSFSSINNSNFSQDLIQQNLNEYDQQLINDLNNNDFGINSLYEFDFQTSDDIKMFLNKFLKYEFPVEKLTAFIRELCNGYSDLLFSSNIILKEVKELEFVKNALNERYKYYSELCFDYEKKMKNNNGVAYIESKFNKKNNNMNNDIMNENNIQKNNEIKNENDDIDILKKEIENNKMLIHISQQKADYYKEKYSSCKNDFDEFKNIFLNENRNLKFKLDSSLKEKEELNKKISEFNKFYQSLKSS